MNLVKRDNFGGVRVPYFREGVNYFRKGVVSIRGVDSIKGVNSIRGVSAAQFHRDGGMRT